MSADHAIQAISLRRLKVVRFSDANDPFELFALNCIKPDVREALTAFKREQGRLQGMLCFSRAWKSPMLWSHYAAGHRGICLGFDVTSPLRPQVVQYTEEKFEHVDRNRPFPDDLKERLLITKHMHWDYEEESRVFVDLARTMREGRLYFYPYGSELQLREVILGYQCPASIEAVRDMTRRTNPGATVAKARLGHKFFEVKIDGRYPPA
jgi:hypothetical protein